MERVGDLKTAKERVLADILKCIRQVREIAAIDPPGIPEGIEVLSTLRLKTYEDINQIQHEEMILRAIEVLDPGEFAGQDVEWHWNPRQRGTRDEPDLRGMLGQKVIASAEITTSPKPKGVLDSRMTTTLQSLADMPGRKSYFVRTEEMKRRAETKIGKAGYDIAVLVV